MPEFEEENVNASPRESYAPSTDASRKPRTRRRSGGFKTDFANMSNASIGEVSANQAFKGEKLSGTPSATQSHELRESDGNSENPARRERKPREPREPRTDANPQPSPETLAAIASVEAKIAKRRADRDKNRTTKTKRNERKPTKQGGNKLLPKNKGLLASILSIFGLGPKTEPTKKRGGNRDSQNRRRGGQNRRRGGQNRRRGGQGGHRNNRRSKEKSES
ncbi:MAG: hypothetical protein VX051_04580 [Verrucomicrobiota bacterium]|nr:hypothetical protein [Verrucomicrobiota bacterium]